mgnify:FL=1
MIVYDYKPTLMNEHGIKKKRFNGNVFYFFSQYKSVSHLKILVAIADRVFTVIKDSRKAFGPLPKRASDLAYNFDPDMLSERTIMDYIEANSIEWNLISEESGTRERNSDLTLIVDPVDGTYNALNNIPIFSISLALANRDLSDLYCAVVKNLATGDIFTSEKAKGSRLNGDIIKTREFEPSSSVFCTYIGNESLTENSMIGGYPRRSRYLGSTSLETCYVASGAMDVFCIFGREPRLFDIAASKLILEEAGGGLKSVNTEGGLYEYLIGETNMRRRGVLAYGDLKGAKVIKELLRSEADRG